jgi:hypothetical protein
MDIKILVNAMSRSSERTGKSIAEVMEEKKGSLRTKLSDGQKQALILGSTSYVSTIPRRITVSCARLFDANTHHAAVDKVQDFLQNANTVADLSPAHIELLCKKAQCGKT